MLFLLTGTTCRATPCCVVPPSSPTGYEQFPFFTNSSSFWKQRVMERWRGCHLSSFHLFADLAKHPAGQLLCPPASHLPSSSAPPPSSGSRGGRPVSAKPIGKQRPKIYFPVSFPSPRSKHSNRSLKSVVGPQFLLTMISIAVAPRAPSRKFDKSQNL